MSTAKYIDFSIISILNSINCHAVVVDKKNLRRITNHLQSKHRTHVVKYWADGEWIIYFDSDLSYEALRERLKGIEFTVDGEE